MKKRLAAEKVTVGILGAEGRCGSGLSEFFKSRGFTVRGSDLKTTKERLQFIPDLKSAVENEEVVRESDVIIFSVLPIESAIGEMLRLKEFARPEQLWLDVTSVKQLPLEAMLQSRAEVVGLHPTAPPRAEHWEGMTVMVVQGRLKYWNDWFWWFMEETRARIQCTTPEQHDRVMVPVQGLSHSVLRLQARMLRRMHVDVSETLGYATPFWQVTTAQLGRMFQNGGELYAGLLFNNPHTLPALEALAEEAVRLCDVRKAGDKQAYLQAFEEDAEHFGGENIEKGSEQFRRFLTVL